MASAAISPNPLDFATAGVVMLLVALSLPAAATVLYNDAIARAGGVLAVGDSDSTHEGGAWDTGVACTDALRPTAVTASIRPLPVVPPQAPSVPRLDVVQATAHVLEGDQTVILTQANPLHTFFGTARDGCIAEVTLTALAASPLVYWDVVDHRGPPV